LLDWKIRRNLLKNLETLIGSSGCPSPVVPVIALLAYFIDLTKANDFSNLVDQRLVGAANNNQWGKRR
jgi:hypothetical protein